MMKVAVMGLNMGHAWAKAAVDLPNTELCMVYDPAFNENPQINRDYFRKKRFRLPQRKRKYMPPMPMLS